MTAPITIIRPFLFESTTADTMFGNEMKMRWKTRALKNTKTKYSGQPASNAAALRNLFDNVDGQRVLVLN